MNKSKVGHPTVGCLKFQILFVGLLWCQKRNGWQLKMLYFLVSIVIKLPVINMNLKFYSTSGSPITKLSELARCVTSVSVPCRNQSIPVACRVFYVLYSWLSSTRRLLNMELSLLLHQCQKLIYWFMANLLLEVQSHLHNKFNKFSFSFSRSMAS